MSDDAASSGADEARGSADGVRDGATDRAERGRPGAAAESAATDGPARVGTGAADDAEGAPADPAVLRARLDVLETENERLRREYVRARAAGYRRAALAMALLGLAALGGAWAFPDQREVLLALAGTGLFGAALTAFLTPERFVAASVAERVHEAHAANQRALVADLDLQDVRVYVPTPEAPEPARLFLPAHREYRVPDELEHLLLADQDARQRGVALVPTGGPLHERFEATVPGEPATDPAALAAQLVDAAVETFELAGAAAAEPDRAGGRVVCTVEDPTFGDLDAPDHPVVSLVGTGLAAGLDRPVAARVERAGDGWRVVYDWTAGGFTPD